MIGLRVPECYEWKETTAGRVVQRLDDPSSLSWATITESTKAGRFVVRQGGPRRLWDEIVSAHRWWQEQGDPVFSRFGMTIDRDGQRLWLDHPGNVVPLTGGVDG
ncbi:hypothetical protein [Actinoplanes sp. NPDC051859]|uniref:hypothetical protein n=1 Tax=Actinoplanes sp. NPDC051859 TaxID=3363909 RepID=UPI0037A0004E